jgi:hypothetical protein
LGFQGAQLVKTPNKGLTDENLRNRAMPGAFHQSFPLVPVSGEVHYRYLHILYFPQKVNGSAAVPAICGGVHYDFVGSNHFHSNLSADSQTKCFQLHHTVQRPDGYNEDMKLISLLALSVACSPVTAKSSRPFSELISSDGNPSNSDDDGTEVDDEEEDAEVPPDDALPGDDDEQDVGDTEDDSDLPEWTIMVYLAGDNNLETFALGDLNEMEMAGSTDEVNLLVEIDRAHGYSSEDGDWTGARRYRVEADTDPNRINSTVAMDLGEVDSGSPAAFIDFVTWGATAYPAKNYALIIWNHGWGWTFMPEEGRKGVASDDDSGNDISIANGEYESILAAATEIIGKKFAIVGMDACLMANWETARVTAPYADYYVASQATESVEGWAFDTAMSDLISDPTMSPANLGSNIAKRFYETDDSTLSVVDLAALTEMDDAINSLALSVMSTANPSSQVRSHARATQSFDGDPNDRDLGDFVVRLAEGSSNADIAAAAEDVAVELDDTIVANFTNGGWVSDATGLSIYIPTRGGSAEYYGGSWVDLTNWDEMLLEVGD